MVRANLAKIIATVLLIAKLNAATGVAVQLKLNVIAKLTAASIAVMDPVIARKHVLRVRRIVKTVMIPVRQKNAMIMTFGVMTAII